MLFEPGVIYALFAGIGAGCRALKGYADSGAKNPQKNEAFNWWMFAKEFGGALLIGVLGATVGSDAPALGFTLDSMKYSIMMLLSGWGAGSLMRNATK